jgi:hypothetical protein
MSFDFTIKNGDLVIGQDGDISLITNSQKLIQDILKGLSTPLGSNQFFQNYGTLLGDLGISGINDELYVETSISSQIQSFLELLQSLQNQQILNNQKVSPNELIAAVKELHVHRNTVDPTYLSVILVVLTKAFKDAQVSFDLST